MTELHGTMTGHPNDGQQPVIGSVGCTLPFFRTKAVTLSDDNVFERECAPGERGVGPPQARAPAPPRGRFRRPGWPFPVPPRPTRLHGMAVPILDKERGLGCISLRFPRSAMTEEEGAAP
ncbi:hypothetical protein B4Q13_20785, partial [Lacticaseibacillus rhamnosus]